MTGVEPVRRTHRIRDCKPDTVFDVVADFQAYPRMFKEISSAKVLETEGDRVRVEFRMALLLPIRYVLDLVCDRANHKIDWTFVEGDVITDNRGGWSFASQGNDAIADYRIALTVKAPVPGFVLRRVVDGMINLSLPAMFRSIEQETRARAQEAGAQH